MEDETGSGSGEEIRSRDRTGFYPRNRAPICPRSATDGAERPDRLATDPGG